MYQYGRGRRIRTNIRNNRPPRIVLELSQIMYTLRASTPSRPNLGVNWKVDVDSEGGYYFLQIRRQSQIILREHCNR